MAKHYPQTLWDAIRAYWENSNASFLEAAKAVCKGEDYPDKSVIFRRAQKENWCKKSNGNDNANSNNAEKDNGNNEPLQSEQHIEKNNKNVKRKADLLAIKSNAASNGLSDVILNNIHLSPEQIDELCEDYRAEVLARHRTDFNAVNAVVDKCVMIFRKIVDILHDGGQVQSGDVIERNGFVHQGMMDTLKMIDVSLKALLNASAIKNIIQTNERKAYSLETYEEPNSTGNLAQKALSSKGMGEHYERIRLSKKEERERMKDKLKSVTQ
jgi:hypothetical protein